MKNGKTIFLIIYLVFHLVLLGGAIVVNLRSEDFEFLFSVRDNMSVTVWLGIIGLILFIFNVIMISVATRNHHKKEEKLRQEINSLKAKVYDLQDIKRPAPKPVTPEHKDKNTPPPEEPGKQ